VSTRMTRRDLLRLVTLGGSAAVLAACQPKVVEVTKIVKEVVKETVEVEKVVKEAVEVEKEVTRIVEKEAKPAAKVPVTIQLHLRAGGELSEPAIYVMRPGEFMKQHPEIEVELAPIPGGEYEAKVQTMAAAKTLGDVMWSSACFSYHIRLMKQGLIAPVDDHLEAAGISKEEWLPAAVETLTLEGKMLGLPKCCHPSVAHIWCNDTMFEAAGFPAPETYGNNHADLMNWAKTMAKGPEGDRQVYGYCFGGGGFEWNYSALRSFGGWEYNEAGTECLADSDKWWEWAQWTNEFFRKDLTPHTEVLPTGGMQALFAAQKVPMVAGGRWMHKRIKTAVEEAGDPFEWSVIQVPREADANGWINCVDTHSATVFSKHPEEAFLLSYAMADARFTYLVATTQGYLTARADDGDTIAPLNDAFLNLQFKNMTQEEVLRQPDNCRGGEVQTALTNELQRIWMGDVDLTMDAMKEVKAGVDAVLSKPF
jgi:ABC-type glycerol-3-phosphate transport system substrate-binding protein